MDCRRLYAKFVFAVATWWLTRGYNRAEKAFKFSMVLCSVLAVSAGVISLVLIRNPKKVFAKEKV